MVDEKKEKHQASLHNRFILRVLIPPFVILLIIAVAGLWQLDKLFRQQAIDELRRAAVATAAKVDREFALRETVLKRTGEEIFLIKSSYQNNRQTLDNNREQCRNFVKIKATFIGAPNGVCDPFIDVVPKNTSLLTVIEDQYVKQGLEQIAEQDRQINSRLTAFKQFFPESIALMVMDKNQQVVSTAFSKAFNGAADSFKSEAATAVSQPVQGKVAKIDAFELAIFAYPITEGGVLAAYDINNENFVRQIWESTPIDRSQAFAVIVDNTGAPVYPTLKDDSNLKNNIDQLKLKTDIEVKFGDVAHTVVGATAGQSGWVAAVASPTAVVLAPARDSRLIGIAVIGIIITAYLWLGTFFIRRTLQNINRLVSGALIFGSGRLDYKISLSHAASEFVLLADSMNAMAWRIADAEKQIDVQNKEFISIATHELRTPLTAILGNLSMAVEDYGDKLQGPVKSIVQEAHSGTLRLRELVNDMLDMARLEGGRVEFVIVEQDIEKIITETVNTLKITAQNQHIELNYKSAHAAPVMADQSKLAIVLNNFVSNAIKYNRPNGSVKIYHDIKDGQLVTAVADTGLGIPDEQKAHMFEKFFRVNNVDRQNVIGTGLGMYITKRYILAMGGRVWFESQHGTGTTFYFSLPLAVAHSKVLKAERKHKNIHSRKSKSN